MEKNPFKNYPFLAHLLNDSINCFLIRCEIKNLEIGIVFELNIPTIQNFFILQYLNPKQPTYEKIIPLLFLFIGTLFRTAYL